MKHKVKVNVPVEKKGLFGKKTVMEKRTIEVSGKTYRKMRKEEMQRSLDLDDEIFFDLFGE